MKAILLLFLTVALVSSFEVQEQEVSLYTSAARGFYNGMISGLYDKPQPTSSKCLNDEFPVHFTKIVNTFLEHGFVFYKLFEDGSLILEEVTDCNFEHVFFDLYELCSVQKKCEISVATSRFNQISF